LLRFASAIFLLRV